MSDDRDLYADIEQIISRFAAGEFILLGGDAHRGGDIDLITSAELITPEKINFLATHARGLICLGMEYRAGRKLGIAPMNAGNYRQSGRPLGVSIEASKGVTTGISAADRAVTVQAAIAEGADADSVVQPGHVFPLFAETQSANGKKRAVDAAVELARQAKQSPFAVLCAVLREDGEPARMADMREFMARHDIAATHITQIDALSNEIAQEG